MRERLAPFLGGLIIGLAIGILVLSGLVEKIAMHYFLLMAGVAVMTFIGGLMVGKRSTPKTEMKLTGRVFEFPQGSVMVEVALRRMKSILPTRVTQE